MNLPAPDDLFAERYRIESILGEGGFATVYLAMDEGASRRVALKVLRPDEEGNYLAEIESRFEREVRVIAQLTNIHTLTLFDFGRCDGLIFMVCEYVPGRDLSALLRESTVLPPAVVVHILRQVLESLAEAHKMGLLHRDIKPENIRIYQYDGDPYRAKLLDFGIARPAEQARGQGLTQDGELIGTPRYMAPEQLTEDELSPASDIYALGLVAMEMLMGPSSLLGNRWSDQFDRLVTGHVFAIQEYEKVGPGLRSIIQRMTAREPEDRFQSAEAVQQALSVMIREDSEPSQDRPRPKADATVLEDPPRVVANANQRPAPAMSSEQPDNQWLIVGAIVLTCAVLLLGIVVYKTATTNEAVELPSTIERSGLVKHDAAVEVADAGGSEAPETPDMSHVDLGPLPPGCGKKSPFTGAGDLTLMEGLTQISYAMHIPATYDPRRPTALVMLFHRDVQTGDALLEQTHFGRLADEHGFLVVAPTNHERSAAAWRAGHIDVEFVKSMLNDLNQSLCIDETRLFAVGHGSGGHLIEYLSCEPWIAGVATNGFRTEQQVFPCDTPKPSLHLAPMNSKRMHVEGGKASSCIIAATPKPLAMHNTKWIERNNCAPGRRPWEPPLSVGGGGKCFEYKGCKEPYVTCELEGGYGWPGNLLVLPPDPSQGCNDIVPDFPATEAIWRFFERLSG